MQEAGLIILSYILGSIPFSYLFSRLWGGVDIRKRGSGNVGATNVLRTLGLKVALPAFIGDFLKGVLAAFLGLKWGGEVLASACAMAAVIGHCYPIFLGFRGGKGVATAGGAVLFLMPDVLGLLALVFVGVIFMFRYVSLGSITAALVLPVLAYFMGKPQSFMVLSMVLAVLVIYKHRENIERLLSGKEPKIGEKA
ncbi:acyl-phosphate glycerol-3-phosphate acyltransferase [Thermosyntropha lipolytica DSM 11003]|uniref:Glycerol-3-phosphate acyltransferase n=1 Tax=Thermosyntropha lipolytica DSM 11003 TaxID=1123382 RepID=A0A1M5NLV8_9FIRM|nr:glycerol-3-phosphate 1-O-acyltransferase PlsY [Thermosyntropha lipolytica]SHG90564.1 acyl-phosphate glycerol-3-phosphate acyltransferase [Thermosyntropha lipolytica DSM 11003]